MNLNSALNCFMELVSYTTFLVLVQPPVHAAAVEYLTYQGK